jgi:hypothetical protein
MSLINDALKRASQAQQDKPPTSQPPTLPTQFHSDDANTFGWLWLVVIVLLVVAGSFWFGLSMSRHTVNPIVREPSPTPTAAPVPVQEAPVVSVAPIASAPAADTNVPALAAAPAKPEPKLQGIAYNPQRPWAIVDGKTVYVGDQIGEFRVKAISRSAVTLEKADGSLQQLNL